MKKKEKMNELEKNKLYKKWEKQFIAFTDLLDDKTLKEFYRLTILENKLVKQGIKI